MEVERTSLPYSCNISSLQEWLYNNSTFNIDGLCLNTETVLLNTHTHRQTHICSVTSSALLSAEQMQRPARQLAACYDFLWALYEGSSWVHPGSEDSNKMCEQEHIKCTRSVHVWTCACVFACVVRQWVTFPAPITFPEKEKGKKTTTKNTKPTISIITW